jgi:hypothetical protein
MNSESSRIATQLRHAFSGNPWHGDPLSSLLAGVTSEQARARPLTSAHSIWELVLHIDLWAHLALEATQAIPMPKLYGTGKDWRPVDEDDEAAWTGALDHLFQTAEQLAHAIDAFPDARLSDTVPGREYDFYYLFHGIVQHSLYHGGQIALLRKAL